MKGERERIKVGMLWLYRICQDAQFLHFWTSDIHVYHWTVATFPTLDWDCSSLATYTTVAISKFTCCGCHSYMVSHGGKRKRKLENLETQMANSHMHSQQKQLPSLSSLLLTCFHWRRWPLAGWKHLNSFLLLLLLLFWPFMPLSDTKQWSWQGAKGEGNGKWRATNVCIQPGSLLFGALTFRPPQISL